MTEIKQYKTLKDIQEIVEKLNGFMARPIYRGNHPTTYPERPNVFKGIRYRKPEDYKLSPDKKWVIPDDQTGLSFSGTWANLKDAYQMFAKRKPDQVLDVYWTINDNNLCEGLKFVEDRESPGHYFLTVTERMTVDQLAKKLKILADRMAVIKKADVALND